MFFRIIIKLKKTANFIVRIKIGHFIKISNNNVIALGGGAFINEKIRKEVLKNNFSFWLNSDTQILLSRIKNSKKRPIAFNLNEDGLTKLIEKRAKIYSKAQFKINCHKLTKDEIVKNIDK